MTIAAIIAEYNPFHNGHEYMIQKVKKNTGADYIIAVMSGNFTQRSECAIYDKYKRTEAALRVGADLVLEIPFPWCSAGAEFFAFGAVSIGAAVGVGSLVGAVVETASCCKFSVVPSVFGALPHPAARPNARQSINTLLNTILFFFIIL